jgi:hypothetical protein
VERGEPDVVQLLCDLSEASDGVLRVAAMGHECGYGLRILTEVGALGPGPRPHSITCQACDADHSATIEFDAQARSYVHSCPEAGRVVVDDADLATLSFNPEWLVDWLVSRFAISYPTRRRTLVSGRVWHLGDVACGDTAVTAVFARRISSQAALDQLASVLGTIQHADKRLVVTTSPLVARLVRLPYGFEFLDLREIGRMVGQQLIVDQTRFDTLVRSLPRKSSAAKPEVDAPRKIRRQPPRRDFREVDKPLIAKMRTMILDGTARNPTDAARALARQASGDGKEASKVTRLAAGYIKLYPSG